MKKSILVITICLTIFSCGKKETQTKSDSHHQHSMSSDTAGTFNHVAHSVPGKQRTEILKLDSFQIIKANIHTALAAVKSLNEGARLLGIVASNEKTTTIISAKVTGRISRLFEKKTGTFINTGQPLFGIYSEQLFTDIKDYLFSLSQGDSVYMNDFAQKNNGRFKKSVTIIRNDRNPAEHDQKNA